MTKSGSVHDAADRPTYLLQILDVKELISPGQKYFDIGNQESTNYYREKLEKLFFRTLNTPIDERKTTLMDTSIDTQTPYLNGGLFEYKADDLYDPDYPINPQLSFPPDFFQRFYVFLNSYHFTTDESTADFEQVAIDPEMLGRIFENLLAEQSEESGEQARKAKGAYYTPREIVDYMCRQSLRYYLESKLESLAQKDRLLNILFEKREMNYEDDEKKLLRDNKSLITDALDKAKILDPACGSGAFPMGMLHIILEMYEKCDNRLDPTKLKWISSTITFTGSILNRWRLRFLGCGHGSRSSSMNELIPENQIWDCTAAQPGLQVRLC